MEVLGSCGVGGVDYCRFESQHTAGPKHLHILRVAHIPPHHHHPPDHHPPTSSNVKILRVENIALQSHAVAHHPDNHGTMHSSQSINLQLQVSRGFTTVTAVGDARSLRLSDVSCGLPPARPSPPRRSASRSAGQRRELRAPRHGRHRRVGDLAASPRATWLRASAATAITAASVIWWQPRESDVSSGHPAAAVTPRR